MFDVIVRDDRALGREMSDERPASALPSKMTEMEPGLMLSLVTTSFADEPLSTDDRLEMLRAHQRLVAHFQAKMYRDIADLTERMTADCGGDLTMGAEAVATEVRASLRYTRRLADSEVAIATGLFTDAPAVGRALEEGQIDLRRARVIVHAVQGLADGDADWVIDRALADAPRLTTGQLRARLERLCIEVDPGAAVERHEATVAGRRVVVEAGFDGTADLVGVDLPVDRVAAATRHVNRLARSLRGDGETRTMDQLRADVFLDLLSGVAGDAESSRPRSGGSVDIKVDLATLAGLRNDPGDLAGFGPVVAEIARRVTERQHDTPWRYTLTDPVTDLPIATGPVRKRPTAAQKRTVRALQPQCAFPGCRAPAAECDLDHRRPVAASGPTVVDNLVPLCRHDHRVRHEHGWTHRPLGGGDHAWTSPTGRTYTTSGLPP